MARQWLFSPSSRVVWRRGFTPADAVTEFLAPIQGADARLGLEVSMIDCKTTSTIELSSEERLSLHQCGEEEAQRFKWIESEKAGRDLGETAIRSWIGQHWNGFLRHRWLEHLQGKAFWIELDQGDFGLLQRAFRGSTLIDPILEHFKYGRENLDIILWAMKLSLPMDEVREILEALDVNSRRIECRFDPRCRRGSH
jgi:hypothetical protein